jgi:hypothetical protein
MGCRFELDQASNVMLATVNGVLTEEKLRAYRDLIYERSRALGAAGQIIDFSQAQYALSSEAVNRIAREPSPYAPDFPRVVISPSGQGYGLSRMYQMAGQPVRPGLIVVHNLTEALEALGIQSCHFEAIPPAGGDDVVEQAS